MKIVEETIRRITISEVPCLDPIRVSLEDIGTGQGRINIECYGTSWACYWGGMGKQTIAEFFATCDQHYLAGKLSNVASSVFDPEALINNLKREVIDERRRGGTKQQARKDWKAITNINPPQSVQEAWSMSETMESLLGEEWWYRLPEKENPDYEYLCRIIRAVQDALRTKEGGAA